MIQFLKNLQLYKKRETSDIKPTTKKSKMKYEDFNFIRTLGTGKYYSFFILIYIYK